MAVCTIEVHVEPCIAQDPCLALLDGLAPDELLDVGMVCVQNHHLCRTPRLAAALDGAGGCISTAHERDGTARCTPALQRLDRGTNRAQVDSRARAALEDGALFDIPVEDGVHSVFDRQDEAGR